MGNLRSNTPISKLKTRLQRKRPLPTPSSSSGPPNTVVAPTKRPRGVSGKEKANTSTFSGLCDMHLPKCPDTFVLHTRVVGRQYASGKLEFAADGTAVSDQTFTIHREPENPADSNAVAVVSAHGAQVGHLPSRIARVLSPLLAAAENKNSDAENKKAAMRPAVLEVTSVSLTCPEEVSAASRGGTVAITIVLSLEKFNSVEPHPVPSNICDRFAEFERLCATEKPQTEAWRAAETYRRWDVVFLHVQKRAPHLISDEETQMCTRFRALHQDAKTLFCRLARRAFAGRWIARGSIERSGGQSCSAAIQHLLKFKFLLSSNDTDACDSTRLFRSLLTGRSDTGIAVPRHMLLPLDSTRRLARRLGHKVLGASATRTGLFKHLLRQKSLFGTPLAASPRTRGIFNEECGEWLQLCDPMLSLTRRLERLYWLDDYDESGHGGGDGGLPSLESLGRMRFFNFSLHPVLSVFPTRADFLNYHEACGRLSRLLLTVAPGMGSEHASARDRAQLARNDRLQGVPMRHIDRRALARELATAEAQIAEALGARSGDAKNNNSPDFFGRFRASHVNAKILHYCVKVLERLKEHTDAVRVLQVLLDSGFCASHRGKWWNRIVLDTSHHCKDYKKALILARQGLQDTCVVTGDRVELQERAMRLWERICKHSSPPRPRSPVDTALWSTLTRGEAQWKCVNISGRPTNCTTGEKSHFFGWDNTMGSVEALALEHYAMEENGGWSGIHCENSFFRQVFGLFLWDAIFRDDLPHVFQTRFQSAPLDITTSHFYSSRRAQIESILARVRNMDAEKIKKHVLGMFSQHSGVRCVGVRWDAWDPEQFAEICACIGGAALAAVCDCYSRDFVAWSGGLPDLLLWHTGRREAKLVEVKGPNDRLSHQQKAWLHQLVPHIPVELLKVSLPSR